jgi:dTDP-D-glucose 4,6-dehydratase
MFAIVLKKLTFIARNALLAYLISSAFSCVVRITYQSVLRVLSGYGSRLEGSFGETDPLNPSSPYSASKAAKDLLVNAHYVTYGMEVTVTRSTNNYGPNQHPEKLIPRLITNALRAKPLPIYGTGENVRDWIFVEDNCQAIHL